MRNFSIIALATKIGVPVPKTVILPSRDLPVDTSPIIFFAIWLIRWTGNQFSNMSVSLPT